MSQSSNSGRQPTSLLVEAGAILRTTLTPNTLATLLAVLKDDTQTQAEIADTIGCGRSTVSSSLRSLADLPLALVRKQAQRYTVTDAGVKVIGLVDGMFGGFDQDLHAIDWQTTADREDVIDIVTPLYDSRTTEPFFILYSLSVRSANSNDHGSSHSIQSEDVVEDVIKRQTERGESTSSTQIRHTLRRFDDCGVITFDGRQITLIEKGQKHTRLLQELIRQLEEQRNTTEEESKMSESSQKEYPSASLTTSIPSTERSDASVESSEIVPQHRRQGFFGRAQSSIDHSIISRNTPSLIPVYCLCTTNDADPDPQSQPLPVLPLTTMSITELIDHANQLAHTYDADAQLEPYWAVWTDSGLQPLGPAQLSPNSDES